MPTHPDQENSNIRAFEQQFDDTDENETAAQTHVRETKEKQSDTPRTDDQIGYEGSTINFVRIAFARTLERELAAVTAERDASLGEEKRWCEALHLKAYIIRDLERQREEQQREIARLKEELGQRKIGEQQNPLSNALREMQNQCVSIRAERDKARAALREHGAHADNCATNVMSIRGTPCTCGFTSALEESK